jgi:hypothetical protein
VSNYSKNEASTKCFGEIKCFQEELRLQVSRNECVRQANIANDRRRSDVRLPSEPTQTTTPTSEQQYYEIDEFVDPVYPDDWVQIGEVHSWTPLRCTDGVRVITDHDVYNVYVEPYRQRLLHELRRISFGRPIQGRGSCIVRWWESGCCLEKGAR